MERIPAAEQTALRLALPCNLGEVRPMAEMIRGFLRDHGATDQEIQASELALVEACNNAIKYVHDSGREKAIAVEVLCGPRALELRVTDNTGGFDWPENIELPEPTVETGRGLFLVQSLMDQVNYFRGRGENCLVMRKMRNGAHGELQLLSEKDRRLRESERIQQFSL